MTRDDDGSVERPAEADGAVGLALSGGGIRSATFNLGIIQVFAKRGLLRWFDYLSTVSGGGYIGSALSATLKYEAEGPAGASNYEPPALGESFVHRMGHDETTLLKHLRSGRDYLAPGGLLDLLRIPAVLLRGIVVNLLVVAPLIGLMAVTSAIMPPFGIYFHHLEFTGFSAEQLGRGDVILENAGWFFLPTLLAAGLFVLWSIVFPMVAAGFPKARWRIRDRFEKSYSAFLMFIGGVLVLNLLPYLYYVVFNGTFEAGPWRFGAAAIAAVLPIATSLRAAAARSASFNRAFDKLKLVAAGLLGPIILLSMYLALTRLVLTPITIPFGEHSSALNVAVSALERELQPQVTASDIIDTQPPTTYSRWASEMWDQTSPQVPTSLPYTDFLATALRQDADGVTASLASYQRQFWLALRLRRNLAGLWLAQPNRFATVLDKLDADPDAEIALSEILFEDQGNPVLEMRFASEELRKDLVLIHSTVLLAIMAMVFVYVAVFVNINKTGLHRFYRDRLSKAYLFDPSDPEGAADRADNLKLSDLDSATSGAPYHLINAALNIPATEIPDLQGRASDFFVLSPKWCGSSATGYAPTQEFERHWDRDLDLATAFAISGAAAAPRMGVNTPRSLALIMTLLNIRLDYWLPNAKVFGGRRRWARRPGPFYLLREISGQMNVKTPFVNLSDGGHIENLGLYELLRRKCKYIVVCDAEQDPDIVLGSFGKLTAYARMDDGVWIDWGNTLERLRKDPATGYSRAHWALGTIHYGAKTGRILYIKSSLCGREWADMDAYRAKNPDFPQQSTGDQFFDEEQFEAYRALGYLIASKLFRPGAAGKHVDKIEDWFAALDELVAAEAGGWDEMTAVKGSAETNGAGTIGEGSGVVGADRAPS